MYYEIHLFRQSHREFSNSHESDQRSCYSENQCVTESLNAKLKAGSTTLIIQTYACVPNPYFDWLPVGVRTFCNRFCLIHSRLAHLSFVIGYSTRSHRNSFDLSAPKACKCDRRRSVFGTCTSEPLSVASFALSFHVVLIHIHFIIF